MERIMKNVICFATGSALTLSVLGNTLIIGILGGIGGVCGKLLVDAIINLFKKYVNNRKNSENDAANRENDLLNRHIDAIKRGVRCGIEESCIYRDNDAICHKPAWDNNSVCPHQVK